jgi:hypothetical protein
MDCFHYSFAPTITLLGYSLSHQHLHFRWPTQGTVATTTLRATMGRTTRLSTRCHPLRLLLSKCWLCKHKYFRLCNRLWSICKLLSLKRRHRHRGIGLEIFSALSHRPFLMLWSRWMLMIGSNLLRRSCKWYSATTMRRCCYPLTNFLVLQLTGGMLMSKPMRNPRASIGWNLEMLSMHIMFPKELSS